MQYNILVFVNHKNIKIVKTKLFVKHKDIEKGENGKSGKTKNRIQ